MKILHNLLGILCGFALMIILLITSIEAVTYWTPGYYEKEYAKYGVLNDVHMEMSDLLDVTDEMMAYLRGNREDLHVPTIVNGQPREFFNDREIAHMEDVRGLFLGGLALRRISIGLIVICVALLLVLKADIRRVLPKMICAGAALFFAVLAVLAGAQRVECCLFGNGERTGNVDAITLAMNMYSHGVDPHLDFSDMPKICEIYERVTRMHVYERTPYAGALVFAAFSGSHQDAIAKGMTWRKEKKLHEWTCPYIPIDPHDIGRTYDADVIRINSQSGKGGIGFLLQQNYGYNPPPKMREDLGYRVKDVSDHEHRELSVKEVLYVFETAYLNHNSPLNIPEAHFVQNADNTITANITLSVNGKETKCSATGNGRLDAVATAIEQQTGMHFTLIHYSEHALDSDTDSRACSYVGLKWASGEETWGCGTHTDIIVAGIKALVSAINNK